jgi:hypothetical protein
MKHFEKILSALSLQICVIAVAAIGVIMTGCSSFQSGVNDGVRKGVGNRIAGIISGGGSSGSSSSVSSGGSSGGTSSAPERNYSGRSQTVPWPSDIEWGRYGLSGLKQPAGTDVTAAALYMGYYVVTLINGGRPAFDSLVAQIEKMPETELVSDVNTSDGKLVGYLTASASVHISVDLLNGDIGFQIMKK